MATIRLDASEVTTAQYTILEKIANTKETAYTVAEAIELCNKDAAVLAHADNKVYVQAAAFDIGTVREADKSLTYALTDDQVNYLQVNSGKYLNGADFTQELADGLDGKIVIVYGNLKLTNDTPGFDVNSIIVFFDSANAINTVKTDELKNAVIYNLQGVRVDKVEKGLYIVNGKKVLIK